MIKRDKPYAIILSPPCTMFSQLQNLNVKKGTDEWNMEFRRASRLVEFAMEIANMQYNSGRYFMFEHPLGASSWQLPCVARMTSRPGVTSTVVDMCSYGLVATDENGEGLVRKPTRLLTNCPAVANGMVRRCRGGHRRHGG